MALAQSDRFVRLPAELLEALLRTRLTETSWRILLWVIRQSYGWHRQSAPYSWYQIARELSMDRGGVVRTGNRLLRANLLCVRGGQLGLEGDWRRWDARLFAIRTDAGGERVRPGPSGDEHPRNPMTGRIASDDGRHRNRCQTSAGLRRAKDSKERIDTYIDISRKAKEKGHHPGAAGPVRGKYDGISEN